MQKRARPFSLCTQPQRPRHHVKVSTRQSLRATRSVCVPIPFASRLPLGRYSESLSLIIAERGVKPALAMKTLSVRFRFVIIGVIAMVAVVSCCYFPSISGTTAYATVVIRDERGGKKAKYVEWKKKDGFDKALAQVRAHNGKICVCVLESPNATPYPHELNNDCHSEEKDCPSGRIRTVKVTKSKVADKIAAGESVANDPNVMHRVQSPDPRDIIKVLGTLKPAVP
jgi:hypothetical protein